MESSITVIVFMREVGFLELSKDSWRVLGKHLFLYSSSRFYLETYYVFNAFSRRNSRL